MGIQDDIFDVESDLENLNASDSTMQAYDKIITYLGKLEREYDLVSTRLKQIVDAQTALNSTIENGKRVIYGYS